ncbi:hypothetical protein [Tardiphaga robiniae]|uniref:Uncharacterized protein n=1 Tax=Tardiphaga robiniae TaxID=943830 RepID=A0A163XYE0_9BRAD|nr:hypothetical protein [Tardiphaga robiniae]KZD21566.1 hypothetical protein A4A58_14560 [Tardiphaga robiniae]
MRRVAYERDLDLAWLNYGDRARMNAFGQERHPTYGSREGVIVRMGTPSSVRVKFDDRVTVQAIHRDYLERVSGKSRAASTGCAS